MKIARLLIFGRVHGVGFRKFVKKHATQLGLVGWVRNLPEGTVEAEVMGDKDAIEQLIAVCRKGPFLSEVKTVDVEYTEKDFPFTSFELRHDTD